MAFEGNTLFTYVLFSFIAIAAILGNALVIYVLVTRPLYLKHPYNILIFSLAITDIVTAFFLVFSRFLYLPPVPESPIFQEIYCRTVWSSVILFDLSYISLDTAVALTMERWLAVVKPTIYRSIKSQYAVKAVAFVWFWGILINITTLFRVKFNKVKQQCTWISLNIADDELPWLDFTIPALIPFLAITLLYSHIWYRMKNLINTRSARFHSIKRTTFVAFSASSAMVSATVPSRFTFMLSKISNFDASSLFHFCLVTPAFSNIRINPILYGIYSSQFRKEYKVVFRSLLGQCRR